MNPNGPWSLYVYDDTPEDGGSLADGWSLSITTIDPIIDLVLTQSDRPDPAAIGTNLTYVITVTNRGPADATSVILNDQLQSGLEFLSLSNTSGNCTNDNGTITCGWNRLTNGAGAVITMVVRPTLGGLFTNVVHVGGAQLDLNPSNNTAVAVTSVTPITDLAIGLTVAPATVLAGRTVTYTLGVTNLGPNLATGIILVDPLPDGMSFLSAVPSQGSCSSLAGTVTCGLGSLASGSSASVTIVGRAGLVGLTTNLVSAAGDQFDQLPGNNLASAIVTVIPAADLLLSMSGSPQPVGLGQPITYTMNISNQG